MWSCSLFSLVILALAGCPAGNGAVGAPCSDHGNCDSLLQCVAGVCVPRCQRAPECGDGYACSEDGLCLLASGQPGDACTSEVDCAPGLSCQIDGVGSPGTVRASCSAQLAGRPTGSRCDGDGDCRNGTCALGHCVDLCRETRDCGAGASCMSIPRVDNHGPVPTGGELFSGCLTSQGTLSWEIPIGAPAEDLLLPIPGAARSATLVFRVDDPSQLVGAETVRAPSDDNPTDPSYQRPCVPRDPFDATCSPVLARDRYFSQRLRHLADVGQSVLQIPPSPHVPLEPGAYRIRVSSFRSNGSAGSAIPEVTAILKMDSAVNLDLHFHFLELEDHPCASAFGDAPLDATTAKTATYFQDQFLGGLRTIFAGGGIALGSATYEDLTDHPELDGLAAADAGALLELGTHAVGVDVFFVRTLSPVGLQAFGPNPGPAGLAGTPQSGVVIGVDTLCYRSWRQLARLTAHELARYMGLYHNVELEVAQYPAWRDPIADTDDAPNNLMFFSELGGTALTPGQREILTKSAVLR